jgi:hypothetical protein
MEMTIQEAWTDFILGLHQSGKWETLTRSERQYFDRANREIKQGKNPVRKVRRMFEQYAPGVYTFREIIFEKIDATP